MYNMTGDHGSGGASGAHAAIDPYRTLGVSASVSDGELRRAYRRLVQLHHPDHNGGSVQSAERFALIQEAYVTALKARRRPAVLPTFGAFEPHEFSDAWAPMAPAPAEPCQPTDSQSGSADYDRSVDWLVEEPASGADSPINPDHSPQPGRSVRSTWAEPWLEERIVAFEQKFAAQRAAAEREVRSYRTTDAQAQALRDEAARRAETDTVDSWDGVERRQGARRMSDWFRGL
jgi:hypothetical protein